jgi:hypothetical protein
MKRNLIVFLLCAMMTLCWGQFGHVGNVGSQNASLSIADTNNVAVLDQLYVYNGLLYIGNVHGHYDLVGGDGSGDITSVVAGSGLAGGGTSGAVTLTVSGVGNTNVASDANIAGSKLADNSITFAKFSSAVKDSIWKTRTASVTISGYNSVFTGADYVCDGIDDQVQINAAIAALPDSGGTIFFRAGTYIISDTVLINRSFVRFVGESMFASRLIGTAANQCMFVAPTGTDWYLPNNVSFVKFENLFFESKTSGQSAVLYKEMNNYLLVQNCYFKKFLYGLWLYGTYATNINGCRFQSCIRGINTNSTHDLMVLNNKDYGWEQDGGQSVPSYFFYGNQDVNLQLVFNSVEHAMPGSAAVHLNNEFAATIALNEFEETGCGVRVVGNMVIPTNDTLSSVMVSNNLFRGLDSSLVLKNTSRVSAKGNMFDRGTGVGVSIIGTCNKLRIVNNDFFMLTGTDIYKTGAVCNQCLISNNNMSDTNDLYFQGGNFGIGTTSPKEDVHIFGNHPELRLTHSTYAGGAGVGGMIRFTNYNVSGLVPNALEFNLAGIKGYDRNSFWGGALGLFTAPDGAVGGSALLERLTILPNGKIGLGTTAPGYLVTIGGQTNFKGSTFTDAGYAHVMTVDNSYGTWCGGTGAGANAYLRIFGSTHATNPGELQFVYGGDLGATAPNSAVKFNFLNGSGNATTKARIDSFGNIWMLGNLGVATTAPDANLDVLGNARFGAASMPLYITTGGRISTSTLADTALAKVFIKPVTAISPFQIQISTGTVALAVGSTNGYVGIAKTNPTKTLDVVGNIGASTTCTIGTNLSWQGALGSLTDKEVKYATTSVFKLTNTDGPIAIGTSNIERIRVSETGSVGLGTTAPLEKLHVASGNIAIGNTSAKTWRLLVNETNGDLEFWFRQTTSWIKKAVIDTAGAYADAF